jgi:YidC/Oxa1 family membrane protein insertase
VSGVRLAVHQFRFDQKVFWRNPASVFFTVMLPLIFLFIFAGFAAGLVIYWCWSNLITMFQQYYIMRRQGVETEFDKFLKKYVFKPKAAAE